MRSLNYCSTSHSLVTPGKRRKHRSGRAELGTPFFSIHSFLDIFINENINGISRYCTDNTLVPCSISPSSARYSGPKLYLTGRSSQWVIDDRSDLNIEANHTRSPCSFLLCVLRSVIEFLISPVLTDSTLACLRQYILSTLCESSAVTNRTVDPPTLTVGPSGPPALSCCLYTNTAILSWWNMKRGLQMCKYVDNV
jgi:hypothetical protein